MGLLDWLGMRRISSEETPPPGPPTGETSEVSEEIRRSDQKRLREVEHQAEVKRGIADDLREVRHVITAPGIERELAAINEQIGLLTQEARETRERMERRAALEKGFEKERENLIGGG